MGIQFKKPKRRVTEVFMHHSASNVESWDNIERIKKEHIEVNGWKDVGYQYFIQKNGNIQEGRPLEVIPAAQLNHNTGTIAICLSGVGDGFTEQQKKSLIELCTQINKEYNGDIVFRGHKEVMATECPHYNYKEWLNLDEHGKMQLSTQVDKVVKTSIPVEEMDSVEIEESPTSIISIFKKFIKRFLK